MFAWGGAKGMVDLNMDSEHQFGAAVAHNGRSSSSGTKKITTSSGAAVNGVVDAQALNQLNYRDYGNSCYPSTSGWRRPRKSASLDPRAG